MEFMLSAFQLSASQTRQNSTFASFSLCLFFSEPLDFNGLLPRGRLRRSDGSRFAYTESKLERCARREIDAEASVIVRYCLFCPSSEPRKLLASGPSQSCRA